MATHRYSYPSRIYRDFFSIPPTDYQGHIRFFERNEEAICQLAWDEHLELLEKYAAALFTVGEYRKYLLIADVLIEAALDGATPGAPPFEQILFRKAASYYQIAAYEEAAHVLEELIRIRPDHEDARLFLLKVMGKKQRRLRAQLLAVAVMLAAFGSLLYSAELLLVRPFYAMYVSGAEQLRMLVFTGSLACWLGGGAYVYLRSYYQVHSFVLAQKRRKQQAGSMDN